MSFRALGIVSTALIGIISQAAQTAGGSSADGFAIAAIVAASFTGLASLITAIATAVVKIRQSKGRRRPSRADLLRRKAELDRQLDALEEDS